jgi:uncharacterized membrane protein YgdD (TMEM256/DUF423 family)
MTRRDFISFGANLSMNRNWLIWGAMLGLIAVATGALGDHLIRPKFEQWFPEDSAKHMAMWEVASRYLFFHALAIGLVSVLPRQVSRAAANCAGVFFTIGVILFSGGLFAAALLDRRWIVHFVPFGGLSFILGWLSLIVAGIKTER